jgi:hypothetical protein
MNSLGKQGTPGFPSGLFLRQLPGSDSTPVSQGATGIFARIASSGLLF